MSSIQVVEKLKINSMFFIQLKKDEIEIIISYIINMNNSSIKFKFDTIHEKDRYKASDSIEIINELFKIIIKLINKNKIKNVFFDVTQKNNDKIDWYNKKIDILIKNGYIKEYSDILSVINYQASKLHPIGCKP